MVQLHASTEVINLALMNGFKKGNSFHEMKNASFEVIIAKSNT